MAKRLQTAVILLIGGVPLAIALWREPSWIPVMAISAGIMTVAALLLELRAAKRAARSERQKAQEKERGDQ